MPIADHMAAEGIDADYPDLHLNRAVSETTASLAAAAEAVLQLIEAGETEATDA